MKEKITKKFGILQGISLSFGIIIGIGIYFKTPSLLAVTGNNALLGLLAWIIGFIFVMFWSFTTAEYAGTVTETGGCLSYVRETAGDLPAFIMGWGLFLVGNPALVAVLSSVAAGFIMDIFGWSGVAVNSIITLIIVVGCFVLNTAKAEGGGKFQSIMTIVKVIPLIALVLFGLFGRNGGYLGESLSRPIQLESGTVLTALIAGIVPVIFSFSGWDHVANVAAEMEDPTKTVPKAIIFSTIASAVVYIAIYLAFINAMPVEQVADNIPFGIATTMFGSMGAKILMACIVLSAVGACNGVIISTMRNPYSLAVKKLFIFPDFFAKIDEKTQVPLNSTILMFIICIIHVAIYETGNDLSNIGVTLNLVFMCFVYYGVIKIRKSGKGNQDSFKTPWFPLFPTVAIITSLLTILGLFLTDATTTRNTLISIAFYILAIPAYYLMKKFEKR